MASSGDENIENFQKPNYKKPVIFLDYKSRISIKKSQDTGTTELQLGSPTQQQDLLSTVNKTCSSGSSETGSSGKEENSNNSGEKPRVRLRRLSFSNLAQQKKSQSASKMPHNQTTEHTVVGREAEYLQIKRQAKTFLESGASSILFITGVPGSGKTHTILSVLNHMKIPHAYVNTAHLKSKPDIYKEMCYGISCFDGKPSVSGLRFHFNSCESNHVILIDEIDLLSSKNDKYLYNLFELPFFENSKVFMIVISNTLRKLSTKIESRIGKNRMEFIPYKSHQIASIIESESSFGSMNKKSIEFISKRVASSTGDIRKAKEITANVGKNDVKAVNYFFKDLSKPLIERFMTTFSIYHKMLIYLNTAPLMDIKTWFESHKSFCIVKSYSPLDFADFLFVLNDLVEFGIYSLKSDNTKVSCNFLAEEIDLASKKDLDFKKFAAR